MGDSERSTVFQMEELILVKTKEKKRRWAHYFPMYLMMLPGIIYLICNNYFPMFGIIIAFKKFSFRKGLLASPWSGFDNFKYLFASPTAFTIIRNTVLYNVVVIILGTFISVAMAILLNEIRNKTTKVVYQSIILLPYLISWVVVSFMGYAFLSYDTGFVNHMLKSIGLNEINWYMESKYWPYILVFIAIWKSTGYLVIVYLASIVGISQEYYEAAKIDGATKWQQIKQITLPLLSSTIIIMLILSLGRIFASDFGLFYQIPKNSSALYSTTQTIDVYVYNALMKNGDYGMSSAASVFQSVVGFVLVITVNRITRKVDENSVLF